VTNSERCISRVRAAVPPPGQARHDWAIAVDVAQRIEALRPPARVPGLAGQTLFPYTTALKSIWNEHRESTRGRDLDITGLSYAALETTAAAVAPCTGRHRFHSPPVHRWPLCHRRWQGQLHGTRLARPGASA
jgi:anaerobic selenocysteine-containing dehydrogenase